MTTTGQRLTVTLSRRRSTKRTVMFATDDVETAVNTIYIAKAAPSMGCGSTAEAGCV
jgi:hypothetical protein